MRAHGVEVAQYRHLPAPVSGLQIKQNASMDNVAKIALQLQAGKAQTPVIISADKGITYDNVVKLMDRLQRAGVQRVGLAVRQSE
jgi:biopolymer transport protein TolR